MRGGRDRFESKVDRTGDHHLWTGSRSQRGVGQIRIDGTLHNATRIAWEIAFGDIPDGARIVSCPDEPACVHPEHLSLEGGHVTPASARRANRGGGTVAEVSPGVWKIGVSAGSDDQGQRRRVFRTVRGTKTDAMRELAALRVEIGDGSKLPSSEHRGLTVDDLIQWYFAFARDDRGLEHSTLTGYVDVYDHWIKNQLGAARAATVQYKDLDRVFGIMRRAGMSHSRMNNARSLLSGAYKWGKRHGKVSSNPLNGFELPTSLKSPRQTNTPELDDLLRLLDGADEHDPIKAPVLKLGATTGMRRGELAGLRRDRLRLDRGELVVDTAINDAGGVVVEKPTKTQRRRTVSIDNATAAMLRQHLAEMDERAAMLRIPIAPDAFVFSLDPACDLPMRPEFMTRRTRLLRTTLGIAPGDFDATILALRRWTTTELMDAGFNPSAVSDRQGHTVQVMLHHYSSRRRSADQAAANHLGARVHRSTPTQP